jgi:hypothetical protein
MNHYELLLAISVEGFNILLCILVFARHLQKRLPFFALYATTIMASSLGIGYIFLRFGFRSPVSYSAYWIVLAANLLTRSLAIAELCRYSLQAYQGIWSLAWRLLSLMTLLFLVHASLDARGQPNWIAAYGLTIERDIEVASVLILIAVVLISNYYRLPFDEIPKAVAIGICFFCLIEFVNSTVLRDIFVQHMASWRTVKPSIERANELWNTVQAFASYASISIWCFALRKPLPAPTEAPVLLPAAVYQELSPAVNTRLRAFNDRILEMLKP